MIEKKAKIVRSEGLKNGFRFYLEFDHDQALGSHVDVLVPEPVEKTPGQKAFEAVDRLDNWGMLSTVQQAYWDRVAAAVLGQPAPVAPEPVKSPGERMFLACLDGGAHPHNWRTLPEDRRECYSRIAAAYEASAPIKRPTISDADLWRRALLGDE